MQSLLELTRLVVRSALLLSVLEMLIGDDSLMAGLRAICILSVLTGVRSEVLNMLATG